MRNLSVSSIDFTKTHVSVALGDGRILHDRLSRNPELLKASATQRSEWTLLDDGLVSWPHLGDKVTLDTRWLLWEALCKQANDEAKAKAFKLDELPPRSREIVALWRLEADGYNGGFMQFFGNWGEENCRIALSALQAIGADATYAIVARQREILERIKDHPDLKSYEDLWSLLTKEEQGEIGDKLDPEFWKAGDEIPRLAALHYCECFT